MPVSYTGDWNVFAHCPCPGAADVLAKLELNLGAKLEEPPDIHPVRDVAPGKVMLCISFRIPRAAAFNGRGQDAGVTGAGVHASAGASAGNGEQQGPSQMALRQDRSRRDSGQVGQETRHSPRDHDGKRQRT